MECAAMVFLGDFCLSHLQGHNPPTVFSVWGEFTQGCEGMRITVRSGQYTLKSSFEIQFVRIYHERFGLNYLSFFLYYPIFLDRRELCTAKRATTQPAITSLHIRKPGFLEL